MGIKSYREQRRSFYLLLAGLVAAAFLSGLAAGILLPKERAQPSSLREAVDAVIKRAEEMKASLELVALEYSEGGLEAEAARGHLERALSIFQEIREDLEVLNRTGTERLSAKLMELEAALDRGDTPQRVSELVSEARDTIDGILEPYRLGGE